MAKIAARINMDRMVTGFRSVWIPCRDPGAPRRSLTGCGGEKLAWAFADGRKTSTVSGREGSLGGYGRGDRFADSHFSPVVTELFAAVQTYDIGRVTLPRRRYEAGFPRGRDRKRRPAVRTPH